MKNYLRALPLLLSLPLIASGPPKSAIEMAVERMRNTRKISVETYLDALNDPNNSAEFKQAILLDLKAAFDTSSTFNSAFRIAAMQEFLAPKNVALLTLLALGGFGAWHATAALREIITHKFLIPPLAEQTSIHPWYSREDKPEPVSINDVILSPELSRSARDLLASAKYGAANELKLRHALFYGPPGTGKTLLLKAIALEAGLEYIIFSASKLFQYSEEEGVRQISRLFGFAKNYPKKVLIGMDEIEGIFKNKEHCTPKQLTFLNCILTHMGTESEDFMVVGITNRPNDLEKAAKSRFGVKLKVPPPGFDERLRLFVHYIVKYFNDEPVKLPDRRPWYKKLFGTKVRFRAPVRLAEDITQASLRELAQQSQGLVGRDISDLLLAVLLKASYTQDQTVTKKMLFDELLVKKQQTADLESYDHATS